MRFPVVIHKDETSGYGITVPDLPGCFSAGDSIEEAIPSGHEAIACHLGGASPGPGADPGTGPAGDTSGQRGVQRRNLGTDRVRCLEALELDRTRVNLTVPERVLDKMAAHDGESRSGLLARAALCYAERQSTQ